MEGSSKSLTMGLFLVVMVVMMMTTSSSAAPATAIGSSPCLTNIENECLGPQAFNFTQFVNAKDPSEVPCCAAWAKEIKNDRECICTTVYPSLKQTPDILEGLLSGCNIGVTSDALCSGSSITSSTTTGSPATTTTGTSPTPTTTTGTSPTPTTTTDTSATATTTTGTSTTPKATGFSGLKKNGGDKMASIGLIASALLSVAIVVSVS